MEEIKIEPVEIRSPSNERLKMEHDMHHVDEVYDNTWTSCCIEMDKRATVYFTQLGIILAVMIFAVYQLLTITDCDKSTGYMGLLTLLLGYVLPSPTMRVGKK
jgi:hypothetical protein